MFFLLTKYWPILLWWICLKVTSVENEVKTLKLAHISLIREARNFIINI